MDRAPIPLPASLLPSAAPGCRLDGESPIVAGWGTRPEAELLADQLAPVFARRPLVVDGDHTAPGPAIVLRRDADLAGAEQYRLEVCSAGVLIAAGTAAGIFRGCQVLLQLLPAAASGGADLAALRIEDRPHHPLRGALVDPARHYLPVADLLRFIDALARHHLNCLVLHLADDQGWRMEIRRHPELTRIGAWRAATVERHDLLRPRRFDATPHGGFYTQDELRRIVAYAAARHVEVVPSLALVEHAQAALAACPALGGSGAVRCDWGDDPRPLPDHPRTRRFCEDVLAEVAEVFPGRWIALDGRRDSPLRSELDAFLARCGRASFPDHALTMVDLDRYQHADAASQPLARGGLTTCAEVRACDPGARSGAVGRLWGQYLPSAAQLETMAFPRLCALAEALWSPQHDAAGFEARLARHLPRLDALGVRRFAPPAPGAIPARPREADRPALIVLAAGMGSRFGGDKQVANVGPNQETILDFTAYDARRAGFVETILVVRRENQQLVHDLVGRRIARAMPLRYAFQDIAEPLPGLAAPAERRKPWGTAHALACALRGLDRPCGVVNADDWYSPAGILALAQLLGRCDATGALITYPLGRTLSPNGPVNRAVCTTDADSCLTAIEETTGIVAGPHGPVAKAKDGTVVRQLADTTPVSLNLWGFQPNFYAPFIADVEEWIRAHIAQCDGESMLPLVAMEGCVRHGWRIRCDLAQADWTGLTYQADKPAVQARLKAATEAGDYPLPLW